MGGHRRVDRKPRETGWRSAQKPPKYALMNRQPRCFSLFNDKATCALAKSGAFLRQNTMWRAFSHCDSTASAVECMTLPAINRRLRRAAPRKRRFPGILAGWSNVVAVSALPDARADIPESVRLRRPRQESGLVLLGRPESNRWRHDFRGGQEGRDPTDQANRKALSRLAPAGRRLRARTTAVNCDRIWSPCWNLRRLSTTGAARALVVHLGIPSAFPKHDAGRLYGDRTMQSHSVVGAADCTVQ